MEKTDLELIREDVLGRMLLPHQEPIDKAKAELEHLLKTKAAAYVPTKKQMADDLEQYEDTEDGMELVAAIDDLMVAEVRLEEATIKLNSILDRVR